MKCPKCNTSFHPQMGLINIGYDFKEKLNYDLYYQLCPSCKKPIVGIHSYPPGKDLITIDEFDDEIKLLN
jgi:hypothetical protein